jgi:hypothetical protein
MIINTAPIIFRTAELFHLIASYRHLPGGTEEHVDTISIAGLLPQVRSRDLQTMRQKCHPLDHDTGTDRQKPPRRFASKTWSISCCSYCVSSWGREVEVWEASEGLWGLGSTNCSTEEKYSSYCVSSWGREVEVWEASEGPWGLGSTDCSTEKYSSCCVSHWGREVEVWEASEGLWGLGSTNCSTEEKCSSCCVSHWGREVEVWEASEGPRGLRSTNCSTEEKCSQLGEENSFTILDVPGGRCCADEGTTLLITGNQKIFTECWRDASGLRITSVL